MDGKSLDFTGDKLKQLKAIIPETFTEDKIDWEKLKATLGEDVSFSKEMIYIDPPYNTGSDNFIYPDKFSESRDEYLKRINEKDEEGYLLKSGHDLNSKIEKKTCDDIEYYVIEDGEIIITLSTITENLVKEIIGHKPQKVICLDKLFADNDQLKTNTVLQMKDAGVEFKTV